jgi:hypothetical protein
MYVSICDIQYTIINYEFSNILIHNIILSFVKIEKWHVNMIFKMLTN